MVKVNAPVDERVAGLVSALSEIHGLITQESCQGNPTQNNAFVVFRLGTWKDCGDFLFGQLLPVMSADLRSCVSLRLEAYDTDYAQGWISLPQQAIAELTGCIEELASSVGPSVLMARNTHC